MLDDPDFLAAAARAQKELNAVLKHEMCRHGQRKFDDKGSPSPCPECVKAAEDRSNGFWHNAKSYMDGVKPKDEVGVMVPKNTTFQEDPGFAEPETKDPASS
jgi:hypothetical protein